MTNRTMHFMENPSSAKIAVIGLGISNVPLIRFLGRLGAKEITVYDRSENQQIRAKLDSLLAGGTICKAVTGEGYLDEIGEAGYDVIFRAPAIRPDLPQLARASENGALLTSEMELFFELCPCRIYGVTGSDGKTTTTTLIWKLLSTHYAGQRTKVWLGGNIGRPLIDHLSEIGPEDAVVLELSSFQLMTLRKSPNVAVITNITPNHLDIHKDYNEYIEAKKNIYLYQKAGDTVVLNFQNEATRKIADACLSEGRQVRLFSAYFNDKSAFDERAQGCGYLCGGELVFSSSLNSYSVNRRLLRVPGLFNAENLLTAIAACAGIVTQEDIESVASEFSGVEHRLEFVRELRGVKYYNSSIDSSPNRTIHTLSVFRENVVLIAGGKDKNIPYDALGPAICGKVKTLILVGPTSDKIEAAVRAADSSQKDMIKIYHFKNYADAVKCAYENSVPGDTVLLSPASTSFDLFRNFEERGDVFKSLVRALE
ncbi:MAG: UDP-N-acetylmuramoyl-L-alanine--D-glutamate ligase [Clostridiales bacterium]|uniref:UDP-N-acetylmuramoylalanine--D-glutamate ligase n=1 Tax=Candidatus Egerieisoma faecipullorum TaxID=2840963 RepID=A0A9D1I781_9CLOT|nr:UDP-N-acetylmuramoyl-L-alanine--D-glutamate ligase [Clostridiales bacterium]PWM20601.1 MAG: UDP-N-acetylmuramoyl-L-alanine--D-glutamate ligase [Clostridiales bacterium]HIU29449.1 UDP-N-acetylmuramoyl-L-alanine--D-glutamate ligase [Candidatus Egerieisoma faecipullorum]